MTCFEDLPELSALEKWEKFIEYCCTRDMHHRYSLNTFVVLASQDIYPHQANCYLERIHVNIRVKDTIIRYTTDYVYRNEPDRKVKREIKCENFLELFVNFNFILYEFK